MACRFCPAVMKSGRRWTVPGFCRGKFVKGLLHLILSSKACMKSLQVSSAMSTNMPRGRLFCWKGDIDGHQMTESAMLLCIPRPHMGLYRANACMFIWKWFWVFFECLELLGAQHAVTFAAGLASEGLVPFCAIYSTFLQRAFDQVVHDVALQKLPGKVLTACLLLNPVHWNIRDHELDNQDVLKWMLMWGLSWTWPR